MKTVIRGALITTGYVHQTSPGEPGKQMKMSVISGNQLLNDVPFVTANSVRGMIRRAAGSWIIEAFRKQGVQISRNLYLSIGRGSFGRTAINAGGATYDQAASARQHFFAGLFGGGSHMIKSGFRLERDLIPILTSTIGTMPQEVHSYAVNAQPYALLNKTLMAPRDDFARLPNEVVGVVEDLQAAYDAHMATKIAQRASGKEDGGTKDDLDNFAIGEALIPGVPLYFGIVADDINDAQLGMLLLALQSWANRNAVGGGSARGRGAFVPQLSLSIDGQVITSSLLVGDAPNLALSDEEAIKRATDACLACLQDPILKAQLESAYPSEAKDDDKEPKKGKGKGKKADLTGSDDTGASD